MQVLIYRCFGSSVCRRSRGLVGRLCSATAPRIVFFFWFAAFVGGLLITPICKCLRTKHSLTKILCSSRNELVWQETFSGRQLRDGQQQLIFA